MRIKRYQFWIDLTLIVAAVLALGFVARSGDWLTLALASMAAVYLVARVAVWLVGSRRGKSQIPVETRLVETVPVVRRVAPDAGDQTALVEHMLDQGRFALLLREQIACNLSE